jgi:hypothetical protein
MKAMLEETCETEVPGHAPWGNAALVKAAPLNLVGIPVPIAGLKDVLVKIRPETQEFKLEGANRALAELKSGNIRGSKVLVISG